MRAPARAPSRAAAKLTFPIKIVNNAPEHPLHPLPRHRPVRAAVRLPGADAEHPAARRPGSAVPQGLLRRAYMLGKPRLPAHRPVLPQQRDAGPGPPRLDAERLPPAPRPPAARRRVPLGADRRAAHLRGPGGDRLRRGDRGRQPSGGGRRPDHDRRPARGGGAFLSLRRLLRDAPAIQGADLGPGHAVLAPAAEPARHAAHARGHGGVQGQRSLPRPGDRSGAQRGTSSGSPTAR
jgi:hypothetical protein